MCLPQDYSAASMIPPRASAALNHAATVVSAKLARYPNRGAFLAMAQMPIRPEIWDGQAKTIMTLQIIEHMRDPSFFEVGR